MFITKKYSVTEYIKYAGMLSIVKDSLLNKEAFIVLSYYSIYLIYSFFYPEPVYLHWITLVLIPFLLIYYVQAKSLISPSLKLSFAFFGLRKNNFTNGIVSALLIGFIISLFQTIMSGELGVLWDFFLSGEILFLLPIAFAIVVVTVGFTEEFFFRGVVQTRIIRLAKSNIFGILITSLLYGIFRIPYYYLTVGVSGFTSWDPIFLVIFFEGFFAGVLLGYVYLKSNENLLSCVILHTSLQIIPMMTIIKTNWF